MAINRSSFSGESVTTNTDTTVEVLEQRPPGPDSVLETGLPPGKLYAYYDAASDRVTLYIISASGLRFLPVQ